MWDREFYCIWGFVGMLKKFRFKCLMNHPGHILPSLLHLIGGPPSQTISCIISPQSAELAFYQSPDSTHADYLKDFLQTLPQAKCFWNNYTLILGLLIPVVRDLGITWKDCSVTCRLPVAALSSLMSCHCTCVGFPSPSYITPVSPVRPLLWLRLPHNRYT